jgi:hypothetical protein
VRARPTINFPLRNETFDFRARFEATYRDSLGRPSRLSCSDVEGSVVWVQEYVRYRLNGCTRDQSIDKVTQQIGGRSIPAVCRQAL